MFTYQDASGSNGPLPGLDEPYLVKDYPTVDAGASADGNPFECEEMLIVDHRANLGPAQQVENKLSTLLGGGLLPISHVRMPALLGSRSHC